MNRLRSESISKRLYTTMTIILFSLLLICSPLIYRSYSNFKNNKKAETELKSLQILAKLTNLVSKERAPANKWMASQPELWSLRQQELVRYRQDLDNHLKETLKLLNQTGYHRVAYFLETDFKRQLDQARKTVDDCAKTPQHLRTSMQLDAAIFEMFTAWDRVHEALQRAVNQSHGKESSVSNYYTLILLLAEFRDQAGRAGSNVIPSISFNEPIPKTNLARFLQTKRQTHYLWELIDVILPEHDKTEEFVRLHQNVRKSFIQESLPTIELLVNEGLNNQTYSMSSTALTEMLVARFSSVVALQDYLIEYSIREARTQTHEARQHFTFTLLMSLVAIIATLFSMYYLRRYVIQPLVSVRDLLLELSQSHDLKILDDQQKKESSIFGAIEQLKNMMQQRDHLEYQLKNLANTDSLTGVGNRFALDDYIQLLESQPNALTETCLLVIDIDHFKQVNDQYGHIFGDQIIQWVADNLKMHVRSSDLVVRYGGDEFLVIMDHMDLNQAMKVANKVAAEINAAKFLATNDIPVAVSVSIGVAVGADSWLSLFEKADQALFKAKSAGRNSVSS